MNLTQMQERLRLELLRRIQRGSLSVSLLARQTGLGQAHMSNFLRSRRRLSLEAIDRILAAQLLTASDLLPAPGHADPDESEARDSAPIASHAAALFEAHIRPSSVQGVMHLPAGALESLQVRAPAARRKWQRFVAVRIASAAALAMEPLVQANAVALLDRHYTSLLPYRPYRLTVYAVRHGAHLRLRYLDWLQNRLVLRPANFVFPVDLLEVAPGQAPEELIVGRVALILNEL